MDKKIEELRKDNPGMMQSLLIYEVKRRGITILDELIEKPFHEQRFVRSPNFLFALENYELFISPQKGLDHNGVFDLYKHTWLAFQQTAL